MNKALQFLNVSIRNFPNGNHDESNEPNLCKKENQLMNKKVRKRHAPSNEKVFKYIACKPFSENSLICMVEMKRAFKHNFLKIER